MMKLIKRSESTGTTLCRIAETGMVRRLWHLTWIGPLLLSGCATGTGTLAAVGMYTPVGERGIESCETTNVCVVRTDTGLAHVSIQDRSVVIVSFAGGGGDVKHYFDYLVRVRNTGGSDVFFDPRNIEGYDESALLRQIEAEEGRLDSMMLQTVLLVALGGNPSTAALEDLTELTAEDRRATESLIRIEKLVAQTIAPDQEVAGRVIVRASGDPTQDTSLSIPVGSDVHTVRFARKPDRARAKRRVRAAANLSSDFTFVGRWVVIDDNIAGARNMWICNIARQGAVLTKECDRGDTQVGTMRGEIADFAATEDSFGVKLRPVDDDTLVYEYPFGAGVFERL